MSAIVRVRDDKGVVHDIPAIVGPKGDPGSDASVTAENIQTALGYTPAKVPESQSWGIINNVYGEIVVNPASNSTINSRSTRQPITPGNLDYALKSALCDGKGAAWTANEQKAARERMGIPGDYELIEEITITEENVSVIARDVDRLCSAKLVIICPPMESVITVNLLAHFGDASKPQYIYMFGEIAPTKVGVYWHTTLEAELRNNYWRAYKTTGNYTASMYPNGTWTSLVNETAPSRLMRLPSSDLDAIAKITLNAYPTGTYIPVGTKITIYGVRA